MGEVYLEEGLVVQGGVGLLQPHALLLVLLQSQGVDGEEGHVGLEGANATQRERETQAGGQNANKFILVLNIQYRRKPVRKAKR